LNAEDIQNILWQRTEDWSDMVRKKVVLELHKTLDLGINHSDFLDIFTESTGYVKAGKWFKRVAYFKDSTLRKIGLEIWSRGEGPYEIHIAEDELVDLTLADTRYFIASEILTTMHQSPSLKGRTCDKEDVLSWTQRIAESIPDSPRWKQIYRDRDKIFKKFEDLDNLMDNEYVLLNIKERETEFRIFTDVYDREESVKEVFSKFLSRIGIENLTDYEKMQASIGMLFSMAYLDLTEEIPEVSSEGRQIRKSKLFTYEQIESLMKRYNVRPDSLTLTIERLRNFVLKDLPYSLIPIFYEDRDGLFRINMSLLQLNNFLELCFSLPKTDETIINKFKGPAFEDILFEILTGKIIILYEKSNMFSGWLSTTDEINLESAKEGLRRYRIEADELRYSYRPPEGITVPRTIIKRDTHPAFSGFLDMIGKEETDIDILLIHHSDPRHIIVGECEFTRKYSAYKYSAKIRHANRLRGYLIENQNAKEELNLPLDYPIIPVLFTSFSGGVFRNKDGVVKTTFPPILWGKFKEWVSNYLS